MAVGINCTDPVDAGALVGPAARASGKPVVIYPNSGEAWDAAGRRWTGSPQFGSALVQQWVADGATYVGGCCRVGPDEISAIADILGGST